jgi:hypothetical protein
MKMMKIFHFNRCSFSLTYLWLNSKHQSRCFFIRGYQVAVEYHPLLTDICHTGMSHKRQQTSYIIRHESHPVYTSEAKGIASNRISFDNSMKHNSVTIDENELVGSQNHSMFTYTVDSPTTTTGYISSQYQYKLHRKENCCIQ